MPFGVGVDLADGRPLRTGSGLLRFRRSGSARCCHLSRRAIWPPTHLNPAAEKRPSMRSFFAGAVKRTLNLNLVPEKVGDERIRIC